MKTPPNEHLIILRQPEVSAISGRSRSAIYDCMDPKSKRFDETFPRPIRLSGGMAKGGAVGWLEHEVMAWIEARIQASRKTSSK